MSYDVQLYRREVQEKYAQQHDESFFEDDQNLLPFTSTQKQALHERLLRYGYQMLSQQPDHTEYELMRDNAARIGALLFNNCLSFSTSPASFEDIFEVRMTASEFTDDGDFAKYDQQLDGWEILDD
jgi:hypothetical protein